MNTPIDSSHEGLHLGLLPHLTNQFKDLFIGHYFAGSGITVPRFKVLTNIFKGNTSPAEICKNLQMDTGVMSRMAARMVKNDLVKRRPNSHDKCQVALALTAKGQTLCNMFQNEALNTAPADLTARLTPEESWQLADTLTEMLPDEFTAPHR